MSLNRFMFNLASQFGQKQFFTRKNDIGLSKGSPQLGHHQSIRLSRSNTPNKRRLTQLSNLIASSMLETRSETLLSGGRIY